MELVWGKKSHLNSRSELTRKEKKRRKTPNVGLGQELQIEEIVFIILILIFLALRTSPVSLRRD